MSHSNTPPVRNRTPLTAWSSSLRCVSVAEHHTAEQYSKMGRTKPRKHLPRRDLSWNTRQDFLKIPSLWEAALDTERRYFSNVYPEWPHRQGGCLACCGCTFESSWGWTDLYYARGAQGVLPMRVEGATSQLDLPSLTPLSVAGCCWLQLGVPHWVASVHYCK